jgi:hypothetical protein
MLEPGLRDRLLGTVPDALSLDDFIGLPTWAVYIPETHPEFPGAGLWAHLEHDDGTGRPKLRLILDMGEGLAGMQGVPVYLDRPTVTESLADFAATGLAAGRGQRGADVHGGKLDARTARFAEQIDGFLAVVAYLARPEADIVEAGRPGVRPGPRRPRLARDRRVWAVGYQDR